MTKELPELSDREIVQLMAAQMTVLDHHEQLNDEYVENVKEQAERYGVEVAL